MSDLYKLVELVHKKNEINKRRKRFYYHGRDRFREKVCKDQTCNRHRYGTHRHTTKEVIKGDKNAWAGYNKACKDMRALTTPIRELRMELNVLLVWDANWRVRAIRHGENHSQWIYPKDFQKYIDMGKAESILLGTEE